MSTPLVLKRTAVDLHIALMGRGRRNTNTGRADEVIE